MSIPADKFYAYYTKLPSIFDLLEDYQEKLFHYRSAYDTSGQKYMIVWLEMSREESVKLEIGIKE